MSDVVSQRENKNKKGEKYWTKSDITANAEQIANWQRDFVRQFDGPEYSEKNLISFVGVKSGSQGMFLFTKVNSKYTDFTHEQFLDYLDNEVKNGNMSRRQANNFISSAVDGVEIKGAIFKEDHRQIIGRHEWWKDTKGNKYLIGTHLGTESENTSMSVQTMYSRLRIDMTEGYVPRGMGDSTIMTVDDTVEIWMDGKQYGTMKDFDGWMISSGTWFSRLHESTGMKGLAQVKGVIRQLEKSGDPAGTDNYLGTKMMQMTAFNRMEFRRAGEKKAFARVSGNGFSNTIINVETNETIDHLSAAHTSKMTSGRFSEFYTVQTIPETSQKIIQAQEYSKNTAAFPVTMGELAMDSKILNSKEGGAFVSALNKYYDGIMRDYLSAFHGFMSDPKSLWEELYKELDEGQVQTHFQELLDVVGESGEGVHHPELAQFWVEMLKRRFFTHGMFKMRQKERGKSTQLYFKPKVNLDIKKQHVSVSQRNTTLVNHVADLVNKDQNWLEGYLRNLNKVRAEDGKPPITKWDKNYNDKITALNQYLKTHTVDVLLSRQPVAKLTGVVLRRLQSFVKSKHGETIFATPQDVLKVFDGDWDGDKAMVEIITDRDVLNTFKAFRKSKLWKAKKKAVNLKYFENRTGTQEMSRGSHVYHVVNQISSSEKIIGMIVNARNTMHSLGIKNMKIDMDTMEYRVFNPTDVVILDYVDVGTLTSENWNEIYDQGDSVVNRTKNTEYGANDFDKYALDRQTGNHRHHLKTTKEHELSILLQMAVDDPKFGFLGQIRINPDFIYSRIFKNNNEESVASMMGDPYRNIESAFNKDIPDPMNVLRSVRRFMNFSPARQGINSDNQKQFNLNQLFTHSETIYNRLNDTEDEKGNLGATAGQRLKLKVYDDMNRRKQKRVKIKEISFNNKLTPQERILTSLYRRRRNKIEDVNIDPNLPIMFTETAGLQAHQLAAKSIHRKHLSYLRDKANTGSINRAMTYMDNLADDFLGILDELKKQRRLMTSGYEGLDIKFDYSEPMALLTDQYIEAFEALTEEEQIVATLYWLEGVSTVDVSGKRQIAAYRTKLPPMKLLHKGTVRAYFKSWNEKVRSFDPKVPIIKTQPQDVKKQYKKDSSLAGFNFETHNKKIDEHINKLCK
tara:strand:+ start:16 stop:3414 length:3399 start_codon:yes stop_codon:yes gene_type:complete